MKNPFEDFINPFEDKRSDGLNPFAAPFDPPAKKQRKPDPNANPFDYFVPDKPEDLPDIPRELTPEEAAFIAEQEMLREEIQKRKFDDKKNVADVFGLKPLEEKKPVQKVRQALKQTEYDGDVFWDMVQDSPVMEKTMDEARKLLRTLPALAQDQFLALFKMQPEMVELEHMVDEYKVNWHLLKETMECEEYLQLVPSCTLDILCSAIGSEVLLRRIIDLLKKKIEEHKKAAEEARQQGQPDPNAKGPGGVNMAEWIEAVNQMVDNAKKMKQLDKNISQVQKMMGKYQDLNQQVPPDLKQVHDQLLMDRQMARELANKLTQLVDDNMQTHIPDMETIIKTALNDATPEVNEVRDTISMWGWADDGNIRITLENKKKALERLRGNDRLKRLAELVGRFRRIARDEKKRRSPDGEINIKSVTTGGDVMSALPSELALLSNDIARQDFLRRMTENRLLIYKKESTAFTGKGPMVVCIDVSGSMQGVREEWSKALALALIEIAQQQKRDFACIHFSSGITGEWEIEKGAFDPNVVIDIAEKFSGGGTNFEKPLNKALDIIKRNKYKKADIVFITDGDSSVSDVFMRKFAEVKREKEFMVRSILINVGGGGSTGGVDAFSDHIATISSLADLDGGDAVARALLGDIQA